jgi:hypothetical protein
VDGDQVTERNTEDRSASHHRNLQDSVYGFG